MLAAHSIDPVVRTDAYDGPLELLLYLVRRDGIDVRALPLAHITREYLSFIDKLRDMDLDVAGDFLVMAATLCELKSRELLPRAIRPVDEAEEDDPAQALARRIIEYQRYREAADGLERRLWLGRDVFRRDRALVEVPREERPLVPGTDVFGLLESFHRVLARQKAIAPVHEVRREPIRWVDCIRWVLHRLDDATPHTLDELMVELPHKSGKIMSFLAVLELCRLGMLAVSQREHLAPIVLESRVRAADADLSAFEEAS